MRVGIADHLGWAVAVTASGHDVVDRRRIELVEPGVPMMPIHHGIDGLELDAAAEVVATVRASAVRATTAALEEIETALTEPVTAICLRRIPDDFPIDLAVLREVPWEARADAVMYRRVLVEAARERGWSTEFYDARFVESRAAALLGDETDEVLRGPRARLGPPWTKDHRTALAATIVRDL